MSSKQIRIVIVDDHTEVRQTWRLLLEQDKRFAVIAECASGQQAIGAAKELVPDIILMEIDMSPVNGLEATKKILRQNPSMKIIGVSIDDQPSYARTMLKIGAKGYVTKNSSPQEMTTAIIKIFNGGRYICEEVQNKMKDDAKE
ncbi:MAG: response regulator transcription factor [Bacteroidetes bacterium]|nr:MAG: response regulator transcription factor [Bacteroidota bacterium]